MTYAGSSVNMPYNWFPMAIKVPIPNAKWIPRGSDVKNG
jgi:hypothetical protein